MRTLGALLFTTKASPASERQRQANGQRLFGVSRPRTTEGNDCDLSTLEAGEIQPERAASEIPAIASRQRADTTRSRALTRSRGRVESRVKSTAMRDLADWWKGEPERDPLEMAILADKAARIDMAKLIGFMNYAINPGFKPPKDQGNNDSDVD